MPKYSLFQTTAISDRPKAKPAWKKEGKNNRKQNQVFQQQQYLDQSAIQHLKNLVHKSEEVVAANNRAAAAAAAPEAVPAAANGTATTNGAANKNIGVKLSPIIRHSQEVVTQLRAQQEVSRTKGNEVVCESRRVAPDVLTLL